MCSFDDVLQIYVLRTAEVGRVIEKRGEKSVCWAVLEALGPETKGSWRRTSVGNQQSSELQNQM